MERETVFSELRDTMKSQSIPLWGAKVIVAMAIPSIACVGFYGIDFGQDVMGARAVVSIAAFPLLLIALLGVFRSMESLRSDRKASWVWLACVASSIVVLIGCRI